MGAGGLGLWTLQMAKYCILGGDSNEVHITVADTCVSTVLSDGETLFVNCG